MKDIILFFEFYAIDFSIVLLCAMGLSLIKKYLLYIYLFIVGYLVLYIGGGIIEMLISLIIITFFSLIACSFKDAKKDEIKNKDNPFRATILDENRKKIIIENVNRGISIFASSGGGKSVGPIYWLGKHFAKNKFCGIINDYKDYELTETLFPLFNAEQINFKVFAPHDVERSVRINPIAPRYIETETDLSTIIDALLVNLFSGNEEDFFQKSGKSLLKAVIWVLKEKFPQNCNLPYAISLILNFEEQHETRMVANIEVKEPYKKLADLINSSKRASMLGSQFLGGFGNERQVSSVISSIADALTMLCTPELFYLLSADEFSLDLNADDNRTVLSLVNNPKQQSVISPINAMITECCFTQMSTRGRKPSFVMLDEAPTLKLANLGKKVSTLRSYNCSFIYCMQDMVQGQVQWNGKDFYIKEILANLSVQFFGKVNDSKTAKYYEDFFEMVEKDQISVSKGSSNIFASKGNDKRITVSKKEQSQFRKDVFFKLKAGEFIMFSEGVAKKFRFLYELGSKPSKKGMFKKHVEPIEIQTLPSTMRELPTKELSFKYETLLNNGVKFWREFDKNKI